MSCDVGSQIDLQQVAVVSRDIVYKKTPFDVITWRHKKIGCTCLLYRSGRMVCHGDKSKMRKYARLLQKMGYQICLKNVKVVTQSAVHQLETSVKYSHLLQLPGAIYEPEIYHALSIKRGGVYFIVYTNRKVVITGVKSEKILVIPTILEMEML